MKSHENYDLLRHKKWELSRKEFCCRQRLASSEDDLECEYEPMCLLDSSEEKDPLWQSHLYNDSSFPSLITTQRAEASEFNDISIARQSLPHVTVISLIKKFPAFPPRPTTRMGTARCVAWTNWASCVKATDLNTKMLAGERTHAHCMKRESNGSMFFVLGKKK